jgi:hypothetical protein
LERPYQIENRRAMQRFEASLNKQQEPIQLLLPAIEIVAAMREGVGELIRRTGLELIGLLMEQEVEELVGKRHRQSRQRSAYRWGKEDGWCRIDGQKVPVKRPRARQVDGGELPLGSYLRPTGFTHASAAMAGADAWLVDAQLRTDGAAVCRGVRD